MENTGRKNYAGVLLSKKNHADYLRALVFAALFVALAVFGILCQNGIAATHTVQVLDCHYAGSGAHTHDASCYDAEGNLVCPLQEREYHVHGDSCYTETRTLVCGQEESEGHTHTTDCYDSEGNLVCGLEETPGHHHDDACWQVSRELTCGREEVTEVHTHGPGCFRSITVEDSSETSADQSAASGSSDASAADEASSPLPADSAPAQDFNHQFADTAGNVLLRVDVSAPEGALPAESNMVATWVDPASLTKKQQKAIDKVLASKADGLVTDQQAVDITFVDASGQQVEPAVPVTVTLTSPLVDTEDQLTVVHLDDLTDRQLKAQQKALDEGKSIEQAEPKRTAQAVDALSDKTLDRRNMALSADQLAFDSDQFSTYVLTVTTLRHTMRSTDDKTVAITVDAPAEAGIPAEATLQVSEIAQNSDSHASYVAQAADVLGAAERDVALARFFDIKILDAEGNELQPQAPVNVKIKLADAPGDGSATAEVVHFGTTTEVVDASERNGVTRFEAEGFSVWGVVYTVDFSYEVDGRVFDLSIPGGGAITLSEVVRSLGVVADDAATSTDEVAAFVADVAQAEFSTPDLVNVTNVAADTTVGALKKQLGLEAAYSSNLSKKQIAEIDATPLAAGDWALVSLKPFTSKETLTVTMNTGEVFTIQVEDAQISTQYLSDSGKLYEVTVVYGEDAQIPDGAALRVTEFEEGSEEFTAARNALLADKIAKNEPVNLDTLGFAALDISIVLLDEDGNIVKEIEPAAPVHVDMTIKALPGVENLDEIADTLAVQHHAEVKDGVVVETVFDGQTEASFQLEKDETVAAEGIVVDPNSVSEEELAALDNPVEPVRLETEFEAATFSTFTISWNNADGNGVKVHYVDENGNELTVKNSTFLSTLNGSSTSPAYLIYDIDGYEYDHTYRHYFYGGDWWNPAGWRNQDIVPQFRRTDGGWGSSPGWQYSTNANYWYNLSASNAQYKDEIYVVYKKKADVPQGGTPTVVQSGTAEPPVAPRINKESTPNGDDTNTLALSLISDTAKLEVEKLADVIVVFDVSKSMDDNDMGGGTTRLQAAKDAVKNLATQLAEKKNTSGDPLVRMSLIEFSTKASTVLGMTELTNTGNNSGLSKIQAAVNNLSADGGTNWDHALQLANEENDLDSGRATFVIFVTDGDPTFRNTRMNVTDLELQGETNDQALTQYGQNVPNNWYLSDNVYGPGDNDKTGKCYDAAVAQGKAIVGAGKNIYTIGISNDVKKVQAFNTAIEGNGAFLAANSTALQQAFADIEASISGASGWGNIQMTDGITNLTNTVQKTGLVNVGGDFTYWKAPAPANWTSMTEDQKNAYTPSATDFEEWDPVAAGAALAVYNEVTHAVEWNMGSTFMPEAGVTYQVRFKVWPSQEAYDYIAKLNNGTLNYDTLPADVKAQIIKSGNTYTLKTNEPNAITTYQPATKTGETVTVSGETKTLEFPPVEDLNLSVDKMKVKKEWRNSLDPDARWKSPVTMRLTDGAGTLYKTIDLNEGNNYTAEDNFISCGLAKIENGELIIYEIGHDFKLTEPVDFAYYWDLDAQVYRPMIIDANLTMLVKTDAPAGMGDKTYYTVGGDTYYKIQGGIYKAISTGDAAATLTATNIRRSNLNLTKRVVDEGGNPIASTEPFAFTITVNDTQDQQVWFSVQTDPNDTSTVVKDLTTNATPEKKDGEKTGYFYANSGSTITVSIQPGWNLRFTNLPNGTTYTITENNAQNYTFQSAAIDNSGLFTLVDGTTTGNGTISESDKQYTVTYTNRAETAKVHIKKTEQDGQTPLQGAVFDLYTKEGYEASPQKVLKTGLESNGNGMIDLGRLAIGEYRLVETSAPDGYILLSDPVEINVTRTDDEVTVTYTQSGNNLSLSQDGVEFIEATSTYVLTVTNNAGVELPSAGGPGTNVVYLLGVTLIGLAGAGFALKRRQRSEA